jgi:hypothetical protein
VLSTENYFVAGFIVLVTLFSLSQIFRGALYGKIISPSTGMRTKQRHVSPFGFWASFTYYVVWVFGAAWTAVVIFLDHRLPF